MVLLGALRFNMITKNGYIFPIDFHIFVLQ